MSNSLDQILLVMIWIQTVCKGYQQTSKFAATKEIVNRFEVYLKSIKLPLGLKSSLRQHLEPAQHLHL